MKSWIHELSESYVEKRLPVRRDLKENYVSLTEEQRFVLLSENIRNYIDEQLQNAYGFGINDLNEEQLNSLFSNLFEYKGALEVSQSRGKEAGRIRKERLSKAKTLAYPKASGKLVGNPENEIIVTDDNPNEYIKGIRTQFRTQRAELGDIFLKKPNLKNRNRIVTATKNINDLSQELKNTNSNP